MIRYRRSITRRANCSIRICWRYEGEKRLVVIHVTHSIDDAVAVGDRMAVMREGRIEQIGAPEEVIRRQANQSVAEALGK